LRQAQGGVVGWAVCTGDHTREYWAYLDPAYSFATSANTPANPWFSRRRVHGNGDYSSYDAWKSSVLQ